MGVHRPRLWHGMGRPFPWNKGCETIRITLDEDVTKPYGLKFAFDVVFGPTSTNEDVFQETTRDLVDVLFAGKIQTGTSA